MHRQDQVQDLQESQKNQQMIPESEEEFESED